MLDELRHRIADFLDARHIGVLCAWGWGQPWALPVQYRRRGLEIECLLPRWTDLLPLLDEAPRLLLVILDNAGSGSRWLQIEGTARQMAAPDWETWRLPHAAGPKPQNSYAVIRLSPRRMDLLDENQGWGFRETWEL